MLTSRRTTTVQLPDDLPIILGLSTGVLVTAFLLAPAVAENALGRPSSTSAVAFLFAPVVGICFGTIAFLFAVVIRWAARRTGTRSFSVPLWVAGSTSLLFCAGIAGLFINSRKQVAAREVALHPHIVLESTEVVAVDPLLSASRSTD